MLVLEFVRLYMQQLKKTRQTQQHKRTTQNKTQKPLRNNKQQKYSSSSRNLKDIYSRSSGGLEDVLYFGVCVCFVVLLSEVFVVVVFLLCLFELLHL